MADVINVNELRPGITFIKNGDPFITLASTHSKSGRGQATVKVKAKNLKQNSTIMLSFTGGERIEKAFIEKSKMQFLYTADNNAFFMDSTTFEQIEIPFENLKWELNLMKEGSELNVTRFEEFIIGVELEKKITLTVINSPDATAGNTTTNPQKKITLETGFEIDAPMFIKENDKVVVSSVDGKYVSKG